MDTNTLGEVSHEVALERAIEVLRVRIVHPESEQLLAQNIIEPGYEILKTEEKTGKGKQTVVNHYLVKKKPERGLTGKYLTRALPTRDPITGQPEIEFELNGEGAKLFGDITREYQPYGSQKNRYHRLAIILDGELQSAPRIMGPIEGGRGKISGQFDFKEANNLANILENPLEAPVRIIEERAVDPSLGKDSIRSGIRASVIGTIAVAAFMALYYLLGGLVANVALILNLLVLLGLMCWFDATLTLPGIAGIVLTAGMAVDANVLIFERIREELAAGKSLRGALAAGYNKAFWTIFDSQLTTAISGVILIILGTGPVKGFGVTLTIGILTSMFTSLVVTRLIFDFLVGRNIIKNLPMLRFVGETRIDFLKYAKPAFVASWLLILVGIGYGIKRGNDVMGVDFAGGDALTLSFSKRVDVDKLRQTVGSLQVGDPLIQYQKDVAGTSEHLIITTEFDSGTKVEQGLASAFPDANFKRVALDKVGPSVGAEILKNAIVATLLAMFGILVYVAFRYEFSFAVGATIAIVHDVLMTMGWFFLTGRELSAPMVAAILTIIGFSINDTIVIFDRIREDLKLGVRGSFKDVMNIAINQTLSRTIITSGTVLLATLSLYIFGGGVINDFAFTFLVGILTGCYSTIFIASAIVLWWSKGERPRVGAGSGVRIDAGPETPRTEGSPSPARA
jgi:SecD/SecF fusion protein